MDTIFVQIASFRDPECQWTIRDLYEKAAYPDRIFVGVCWQADLIEDAACFEIETRPAQVRTLQYHWSESRGVCWARHQAQRLWQDEKYVLSIDSHMRFEAGWDEQLIAQLAMCNWAKAVLTSFPAAYMPPNKLRASSLPSVIAAGAFEPNGSMFASGAALSKHPPQPLRGAFVAPGFVFSSSSIITDIPYDPYLYFDQEALSLAVRFFTHGYNVYSPSNVCIYHYYDHASSKENQYLLHWTNNPESDILNTLASQRFNHLVGHSYSTDSLVTQDLEKYGLGQERSLQSFEEFCGISFQQRKVSEWAMRCGFIKELSAYLDGPVFAPALDSFFLAHTRTKTYSRQALEMPNRLISVLPSRLAAIHEQAPPGVLYINDYLSPDLCQFIRSYAESQSYKIGGVLDLKSTEREAVLDEQRNATFVEIDGIASELIGIFHDIYCNRVAPFFDVDIEWFERPHLLRYPPGGKYIQHADSESWMSEKYTWERHQNRDYSVILYLNEDFSGGQLKFTYQNFTVTPKPGTLLAFPSDHCFLHAVLPTISGIRYAVVSWAAIVGSERVREEAPFGSVYVRQRRLH